MPDLEQAAQTQLKNISKKTGKGLKELFQVIEKSGLTKHGQIRDYLKSELGLGHGDANTLTHVYRQRDKEEVPLDDHVSQIYSGKKEHLRPIHDAFMESVREFGAFEIAPKKGYLSLRRDKQFVMVGPPTNSRVEIGINATGLKGGDRLIENKPGSMSQYKVKVTAVDQVDDELLGWVREAFESAG
ncbi:MAG: DUF4287 domain-containing protein [Anaerolineales bacterium]